MSGAFAQRTGVYAQTTGPAVISNASHVWDVKGTALWNIGGGVTLFAPSLLTVGAAWTQLDASVHEDSSIKTESFGLKAESGHVAIGGVALKFEVTALSVGIKGAYLENNGLNLADAEADLRTAAVFSFS